MLLRKQIEAGKLWVEQTVRDVAEHQQISLQSMQWIFCPSPLAYRFYLLITSGERSVAGEFNYAILEDCRRSRSVQEMLRAAIPRLLTKLLPEQHVSSERLDKLQLAAAAHD
jgi:hypothetical protein